METPRRAGRQLPQLPSKIPVRRDQSLPSSGRSTPCSPVRPAMKREGSSPAGLMTTPAKPRPPIAPKPSHTKITARLSLPSAGRGRPQGTPAWSPVEPAESLSGRSTPSSSLGRLSKIPRPDKVLKKWDSTSRLEVRLAWPMVSVRPVACIRQGGRYRETAGKMKLAARPDQNRSQLGSNLGASTSSQSKLS